MEPMDLRSANTIRERIDLNQESFSYNEKYLKTILSNMVIIQRDYSQWDLL